MYIWFHGAVIASLELYNWTSTMPQDPLFSLLRICGMCWFLLSFIHHCQILKKNVRFSVLFLVSCLTTVRGPQLCDRTEQTATTTLHFVFLNPTRFEGNKFCIA